jgi:hypothetical protein
VDGHADSVTPALRASAAATNLSVSARRIRQLIGSVAFERLSHFPIPYNTRGIEHRDLPTQHAAGWPHLLARLSIGARSDDLGPDPFAATGDG